MLRSLNWRRPSPLATFLIVWPLLGLLMVLALSACQTTGSGATSGPAPVAVTCLAFKPIRWSVKDTLDTQQQARAHNAAGASLCGWKP